MANIFSYCISFHSSQLRFSPFYEHFPYHSACYGLRLDSSNTLNLVCGWHSRTRNVSNFWLSQFVSSNSYIGALVMTRDRTYVQPYNCQMKRPLPVIRNTRIVTCSHCAYTDWWLMILRPHITVPLQGASRSASMFRAVSDPDWS